MKALEITNLNKTYKEGVKALIDVSFEVEEGEFFALLGPNGAGKSTTIGIVTSLVNKSSGKVKVFGYDIDKDTNLAKSFIGLVPQEYNFNIFEKVNDIILQQAGYYGVPRDIAQKRSKKLLTALNLWDKRNTKSMSLSGGMKRKLMIARSLIHKPKLLILDEPTAGVDVETRRDMWEFLEDLNKNGTTIILTTHYLEEAESLCREIVIINKAKIVENTSMKNLLGKLHKESFIADLEKPIKTLPKKYNLVKIDKNTLSFDVCQNESINDVINLLNREGIKISSLRNKVNRLEELFVEITK